MLQLLFLLFWPEPNRNDSHFEPLMYGSEANSYGDDLGGNFVGLIEFQKGVKKKNHVS